MKALSKIRFLMIVLLALSFLQLSAQEAPQKEKSKEVTKKTDATKTSQKDGETGQVHGRRFVDENGDGYNDNAPDHDGDGIPNGIDSDYLGEKIRKGNRGFVDLNGDGINDNTGAGKGKSRQGNKAKFDSKFGNGKAGVGPQDGTGNGTGASSGNGNGNGSNGNKNQSKGKGKGGN